MLTNNIQDINTYDEIACRFASVIYDNMLVKRYGVNPCKKQYHSNRTLLEYEKLILNQLLEGDCKPCRQDEVCYLEVPKCCNKCENK